MNYFEYHIGDYIKNTAHLSMLEDCAYRRLIDAYYTREAPLPPERTACYRLARAQSKEERAAVDVVLDEFFELQVDGWHQNRCDEEIARFREKSEKARASADARWGKSQSEGNADVSANAMRTHSEGNATRARPSNQTPETSNHKNPKPKAPGRPVEIPDWMPLPQWEAYLEMRQRIRKPATTYAQRMAIAKLSELRDEGQNPAAVLGQSIMNSWQGIFPLKGPARVA